MKILQINTVTDSGSTGRTTSELSTFLTKNGAESHIAYGHGYSVNKNSIKIGTIFENNIHNLFSRVLGKQGYYTKNGTLKLIDYIKVNGIQLIHLRNLHGNYINLNLLFDFLIESKLPVVLTLHDCWAFTGKCSHYSTIGCYKWKEKCYECPQLSKYPSSLFFDKTTLLYYDKKRWFSLINNLTIVTVSDWLLEQAKMSFLKENEIIRIYNWIDQKVFKPTKSNFKNKFLIPENKFIIMGISAGWKKNDSKLIDFVKLSKIIDSNMHIVLIGKLNDKNFKFPNNITHINYISSKIELAEAYSSADVYFHASLEDTFGKVIAESLSCGTPSIVYNSTAIPELIGDNCGYVVKKNDINAVYSKVEKIFKLGKINYSHSCINFVQKKFNYQLNSKKYYELYKKILKC